MEALPWFRPPSTGRNRGRESEVDVVTTGVVVDVGVVVVADVVVVVVVADVVVVVVVADVVVVVVVLAGPVVFGRRNAHVKGALMSGGGSRTRRRKQNI